jgi:hypothetical protein
VGELDSKKLLAAVRRRIEAEPCWVLVLDNADDLGLFGVGQASAGLSAFVPRSTTGTVLWTSRDKEIGSLVGPLRAINLAHMTDEEAIRLLETVRGKAVGDEMDSARVLLAELDWLPPAISQAAAYMWRMETSIKDYLSKLYDSKKRWKLLKQSQFDRHCRHQVPNSILET